MAQKTVIQLTDDLGGGKADRTIAFGLDGKSYEIDLNKANAEKLLKTLDKYIAAARRANQSGSRRNARRAGGRVETAATQKRSGPGPHRRESKSAPGDAPGDVVERWRNAGSPS